MKEINIDGIFVSPIAGDLVVAFVIYYVIRRLFIRGKVEKSVWHPQLFNLCIFLIILCALALLD